MIVKHVIILKDVSDDLNDGKAFYDQREAGVGDYFWDSLLADIESMVLYAGIHRKEHGFYRMLAKRFPYAIYYLVEHEEITRKLSAPAGSGSKKQIGSNGDGIYIRRR